eukprot:TRINITY_DN5097_c0_g1_i1.p1 TRINITY_DN5097_c0_g1~~TRINITY_DN5097_c0_g1_i1.p1  ORF type:complete len:309 (-),score=72.35 TRINITY_DN5097_c0_g1_i1:1033-1959(-)
MRYHKRILILLLLGTTVFLGFLFLFASHVSRDLEASRGASKQKLCLLIPFRDRWRELLVFMSHMSSFLANQGIHSRFIVVHQTDTWRFNRASLLNAGFLESPRDCDYFALHDVDLIPLNSHIHYEYPGQGPLHLTAPGLHPKYDYASFFGGILLITREDFFKVNGMSNNYWGWGLEDDEFRARVVEAGLTPQRPTGILTSKEDTFEHINFPRDHSSRDMVACFNQRDVTHYRDRSGGLNSVEYALSHRRDLTVDGYGFSLLDVRLTCDKEKTPWCTCTNAPSKSPKFKVDEARRKDLIVPRLNKKNSS